MTGPDTISEGRRQLVERLRRNEFQDSNGVLEPLTPHPPAAQVPLSPGQGQVWFHCQLAPSVPAYNESVTIHRRGPLDPVVLERCFNEIVRRHEIWRSAFPTGDGKVVQRIDSNVQVLLPLIDLSHLSVEERQAEAVRIATEDVRRPFDVNAAPLFRVRLVRFAEDYHRIYLTLHHLVFDGVSIYCVLIRELAALYEAYTAGQPSPLPELAVQYRDYAAWEQRNLANDSYGGQMKYWRETLSDCLPSLQLPTDRPRPAEPTWRGGMETCTIPAERLEALQELGRSEGVTPYMVLLAVFEVLLHRYSGQDEIIVGGATNTRTRPEFEPLIGYFLNPVVFRSQVEPDLSFREFLRRVQSTVLGTLAHSDIPFDAIVRALAPKRDVGRHPLFQVLFSMRPFTDFPEGWDVTDMEVHSGATGFDLSVEFSERPEGLAGRFIYSTDLYDRATIQRLVGHFQVLFKELVADPDQTISRVPLLTAQERHTLLVDWNNTSKSFPNLRIHELFEAQAEGHPDHPALIFRDQQLTYAELNTRANKLAHCLRQKGAASGSLVGIYMERSFEMVVALLAVLKSGAAYVPYEPELPLSRLNMTLEDSRPVCVITQRKLSGDLSDYTGEKLVLDAGSEGAIDDQPGSNPRIPVEPRDAIYAIYTSGSTGVPKAAINTHEAVANRILWMQDQYPLQASDRVLQKTPCSFDVSVWEFFWPISSGATLVIAEPGRHGDPDYIADLISSEEITAIHFVPSVLREFLDAGILDRCGSLKRVFSSGEALPPDLRRKFYQRLEAELHNLYGPTEAAVEVTYWDCANQASCASVPIGRPISNVKLYILDQHLAPVPIGVSGELHIGGIAVARGYLNRPELTAERFIPDPFDKQPSARLYKTGDRARFLADGNIEYLGRLDSQVKLRGFRIELGDIEATLLEFNQVRAATVLLREDDRGQRLVAYLVPNGSELDAPAVRAFLRERLPQYMIPAAFVAVESIPKTASGKLDRKALPAPELAPDPQREFVPPDDEIEERLTNLWQEVLGVQPIGVTDNYFDLGGHSLLALRLFSGIKFCFQIELPLATLFYAPTVRTMARIIADSGFHQMASPVVPIQPNGTKPAIFCVGALNGEVILFRRLALELGQDRPLYGLQPFSLVDRLATVETIAASYIEQLQQQGERQPFCLLGYSFGGLVALEMAQQLRKSGVEPPIVALIDTTYMAGCKAIEPWKDRVRRYWYHLSQIAHGPRGVAHLAGRLRSSSFRLIHKVSTGLGVAPPKMARDIASRQLLAGENYRAKPYPGRVYLFRAESRPEFFGGGPNLGWGGILSDMLIEEVPGDHGTINTGMNLKILARKLTASLEDSHGPQGVRGASGAARCPATRDTHSLPQSR